jgi:hypothetical protein
MSEADNLEHIGHAMMLAWGRIKKAQARLWGEWMTIGEGLMEGRRWAMRQAGTNKPEGKGYTLAYGEWLKRFKVDDMDKSDRAKLLQLMDERPAIEEWRASLPDRERRSLNNPTIVWRKWTAVTRVKKPRPVAVSPVLEAAHARADAVALAARIEELEQELETARARIQELETELGSGHDAPATLQTKVDDLELSVRTCRTLINAGFVHVGDLVQKSEAELRRNRFLRVRDLEEIKKALAKIGFSLADQGP